MPGDNVDRAIKRGAGELNDGAAFEEFNFEGYAPGGVALVIQCLSDNRNRTTADVRHLLTRYNGKLGTTGSVLHQFARKGVIAVSGEKANEDALMEIVLEAKGFEDMKVEEEGAVIYTDPAAVSDVQEALEKAGVKVDSLEVGLIPSLMVKVDGKTAEQF
jgi:YebC/PmpR family DNA-binding regulatory protein